MALSPDGQQLLGFDQGYIAVVDLSSGPLGAVSEIDQDFAITSAPNAAQKFANGVYIGDRMAVFVGPGGPS